MKDFLGNNLEVGDRVVYITKGYRDFSIGKVLRFTKYFTIIEWGEGDELKQKPKQLIKI